MSRLSKPGMNVNKSRPSAVLIDPRIVNTTFLDPRQVGLQLQSDLLQMTSTEAGGLSYCLSLRQVLESTTSLTKEYRDEFRLP